MLYFMDPISSIPFPTLTLSNLFLPFSSFQRLGAHYLLFCLPVGVLYFFCISHLLLSSQDLTDISRTWRFMAEKHWCIGGNNEAETEGALIPEIGQSWDSIQIRFWVHPKPKTWEQEGDIHSLWKREHYLSFLVDAKMRPFFFLHGREMFYATWIT